MLDPLIPRKLVVGKSHGYGGLSLAQLEKEGITAVIDLNQDSKEMNEAVKTRLLYVKDSGLKVQDDFQPIQIAALRYIVMRIHQLISQGHYVYLHCSASRGRSPTVAAAYLICLGRKKEEAMNAVRTVSERAGRRAWIGRDLEYATFLSDFEKSYRGYCPSEQ